MWVMSPPKIVRGSVHFEVDPSHSPLPPTRTRSAWPEACAGPFLRWATCEHGAYDQDLLLLTPKAMVAAGIGGGALIGQARRHSSSMQATA